MILAAGDAALEFVHAKRIGLSETQCVTTAKKISAFIHAELSIEPDRVFIELIDLPRTRFAWYNKTFG